MFNDLCKLIFKDISNYLKFNINIINNNKSNSNDNNLNKIIDIYITFAVVNGKNK